ncbi:MAG: AarF/ABC1/UbiB kinase family protein [Nitrospirota bacterium]
MTEEYAEEFRKLLDEVPPFPATAAREIISAELGRPLESVFSDFDDTPVAAASIAQVHDAILRDGAKVIVKVQRPRIEKRILDDIDIMTTVARLLETYMPESKFFNPSGIVQEFSRTVRKELDFTQEARNCMRFARNFEGVPAVCIPKAYDEYLTHKVLVMERVVGVSVDQVGDIDRMGLDKPQLSRTIVDAYLKMMLEDGFFHADPHPGNIFIMPDGRVCFMDFGIVGRVSDETKQTLAETFVALLRKDYDGLVDNYVALGYLPEDADVEHFRREFKADLIDLLDPLYGVSISEINLAEYLDTVLRLARTHRLSLPTDLLLINKTLMLLDGVVRGLDPQFNFIEVAEPYAQKLLLEKFSPSRLVGRLSSEVANLGDFLLALPTQSRKIINKIRNDLHLKHSLTGLEKLIKDMDRSSNRIAFALVLSSIILSSAIMNALGTGPKIMGLSVLGILTFFGAVILGIWLLISIIRSGRL